MEIIDNDNSTKTESQNTNSGSRINNNINPKPVMNNYSNNNGRAIGGVIIVAIGLIFLGREMGFYIPRWLYSWEMILIAVGIYSGVKNNFENASWLVMILIGSVFLIRRWLPDFIDFGYVWPIGLIIVGLYVIVKPRSTYSTNKNNWNKFNTGTTDKSSWQQHPKSNFQYSQQAESSEYLDSAAVFGSVRKSVISKDFKGGEISSVFGSSEVNLSQADITQIVELEVNAVFGGVRLIVPSHWEIKSELTAVLGSVEDKRPVMRSANNNPDKFLVLKGNAVFGGIEILSYN